VPHDRKPFRDRNWNQLLPEERAKILEVALLYPESSPKDARLGLPEMMMPLPAMITGFCAWLISFIVTH
jgi:hypothetical protein